LAAILSVLADFTLMGAILSFWGGFCKGFCAKMTILGEVLGTQWRLIAARSS
jgi:hypothetical protein